MSGKKKSTFKSVLTVIITLLLIILAVGFIFKYTKAGDKIKDLFNPAFRIECNGKDYDGENNVIALSPKGQAQFKVKGVESYKIMLTPNVTSETDFEYEVNGGLYRYSQADLSKVFTSGVKDGYFYINCIADYSLENVLSTIHGGEVVLNVKIECPYLLTFTSDNKTVKFAICAVLSLDLSDNNIVF